MIQRTIRGPPNAQTGSTSNQLTPKAPYKPAPAKAGGAPWLKTTLIQCAWAAARTKGSYLQAQFQRLRSRRGAKKAIGAVAASVPTAAYHMLKNGTLYEDLGSDHFDRRAKGKQILRLVSRIQNLGFAVQITPIGAAE